MIFKQRGHFERHLVVVAAVSAAIVWEHTRRACWFWRLAKTKFTSLPCAVLAVLAVPSPMEDCQNPNLLFSNNVIDTIELEAMDRRAAHVGKSNSMEQRRFA